MGGWHILNTLAPANVYKADVAGAASAADVDPGRFKHPH